MTGADYDPLTLPAAYFEGLPAGVRHNLPSQPEPVEDMNHGPLCLARAEQDRLRTERDELQAKVAFLRTALEGIATTDLNRDGSADLCYCRWFVGVAKQALKYTTALSPAG